MRKTYEELKQLETLQERFNYLKLDGDIWETTFGPHRWINQRFYQSQKWRRVRAEVILRDNGCDLGVPGHEISDTVYIHHINPITKDDILNDSPALTDLNNLISASYMTHTAIHYGDETQLPKEHVERTPNDTCPWKR